VPRSRDERFVYLTQRRKGANDLRFLCVLAPLREIPKLFPLNFLKDKAAKAADCWQHHLPIDDLSGFSKILFSRRVTVCAQLSAERSQADAKCFGGFGPVSVATLERRYDQAAFHFVERDA
jgi:hypothetical protein